MNTHALGSNTLAGGTNDDGGGRSRTLWKTPAIVTALVLTIPLMGNLFVEGWNWRPGGFVVAGILVFGFALVYQLITRNVDTLAYRAAAAIALGATFILYWMNFVQAADDVNPHAMQYFWVPLVGGIGAAIARFRQRGMARALFATTFAQVLVLTITVIRYPHLPAAPWASGVWRGLGLNSILAVLFLASALLFRTASRMTSDASRH